jgi:hypothetical protein
MNAPWIKPQQVGQAKRKAHLKALQSESGKLIPPSPKGFGVAGPKKMKALTRSKVRTLQGQVRVVRGFKRSG